MILLEFFSLPVIGAIIVSRDGADKHYVTVLVLNCNSTVRLQYVDEESIRLSLSLKI